VKRLPAAALSAYPPCVRPSLTHRLSAHLAAVLVGLLMLVSAAPCTVHAAASQPAITAPADPCLAHHAAAGCVCAQLACQHAADLNQASSAP
jgi:hypothetical protein